MNQNDSYMQMLLHEKSQQEERLRDLDRSLLQLALAVIAALALCAPAVLSTKAASLENKTIAYLIITQVLYLALFFCVMIVRSRNKSLTFIAVLCSRVNEVNIENKRRPVLFTYSFSISDFTRSDRLAWFSVYFIVFLIVLSAYSFLIYQIIWYVALNYARYFVALLVILSLEMLSLIGFFSIWRMSQVDKNLKRIEKQWKDYEQKYKSLTSNR